MAQDLQGLMDAIAQMEGYNTPGTIAQRNNNPGNLRYAPTQSGSESTVSGTYATFATAEDGWNALQSYIETQMAAGVTLRQFIYTYAPPSENNTSDYLNWLVSKVGIGADSLLSSLGAGNTMGDSDNSNIVDLGGNVDPTTIAVVLVGVVGMAAIMKLLG